MTITNTIIARSVFGNRRAVAGYATNDSTGGEVVTGLNSVDFFMFQPLGASATEKSVNEEFPLEKGDVTVVTENGVAFCWLAIGK